MTAQNLKTLLIIFIFLGNKVSYSQSLVITGKFLDKELMTISANYTLVCDQVIAVTGRGEEVNAELKLNKNYKLIVGVDFQATQLIFFSTNTDLENKFYFDFELILKGLESEKNNPVTKKSFVYFNPQKKVFDYNRVMITKG